MITNSLPMHPGRVLAEVYMSQIELNQTSLAELCECSPRKINKIVSGKRGIPPTVAFKLQSVIGTTATLLHIGAMRYKNSI